MTDKKTVDVGQIENAKRLWVDAGGRAAYWPSVPYEHSRKSFDARMAIEATSPVVDCFGLAGFYNDDDSGDFFLFCEADCFDPPQYLIRARSFESAYEIFVEEFASVLDADTLADYAEDDDRLYHVQRGAVDTESINGCEVKLLRVDC